MANPLVVTACCFEPPPGEFVCDPSACSRSAKGFDIKRSVFQMFVIYFDTFHHFLGLDYSIQVNYSSFGFFSPRNTVGWAGGLHSATFACSLEKRRVRRTSALDQQPPPIPNFWELRLVLFLVLSFLPMRIWVNISLMPLRFVSDEHDQDCCRKHKRKHRGMHHTRRDLECTEWQQLCWCH